MKSKNKSLVGHYAIFILTLFVGLLINVSANVIYDLFVKDNSTAQGIVLILTGIAFTAIIYLYHNKLREPLAKFLQDFE
ncbi:hypothetical protein HYS00_00685 [Candidatus Microgenomates bacterium]|nr:hypothetical protein [Candidatus Microgenomates bacterium]